MYSRAGGWLEHLGTSSPSCPKCRTPIYCGDALSKGYWNIVSIEKSCGGKPCDSWLECFFILSWRLVIAKFFIFSIGLLWVVYYLLGGVIWCKGEFWYCLLKAMTSDASKLLVDFLGLLTFTHECMESRATGAHPLPINADDNKPLVFSFNLKHLS